MLLAFGIVLFTIAVYMGLDAVTVRQKQVAGSLARARRYGGGTLRETELTKRRHEPADRPCGAQAGRPRDGAADDAEPGRDPPPPDRGRPRPSPHPDVVPRHQGRRHRRLRVPGRRARQLRPPARRQRPDLRPRRRCAGLPAARLRARPPGAHAPHQHARPAARGARPAVRLGRGRPRLRRRAGPHHRAHARARCSRSSRSCCTRCASARAASRRSRTSPSAWTCPRRPAFARSIIQAEQLGMSLGRILRVQAGDSRNKRQMAAEEKAMKAPIKMLFPTVIFIFPAMFIVILGPAMLQLLKLERAGPMITMNIAGEVLERLDPAPLDAHLVEHDARSCSSSGPTLRDARQRRLRAKWQLDPRVGAARAARARSPGRPVPGRCRPAAGAGGRRPARTMPAPLMARNEVGVRRWPGAPRSGGTSSGIASSAAPSQ